MKTHNIFCLTLLISSAFLYNTGRSELCHPNDKKALLQIKKASSDPNALSLWDPQTDCCEWSGLECDPKTHRIIKLLFSYVTLVGPIPPEVGDLPYLQTLDISSNHNLTGPIPPAVAKLRRLRRLMISFTGLSGRIPDFLSQMKTLELIFFSYNSLSGPIPSSIATLPNLTGLRLDRNKLTGPIPDTFGEFKGENFDLYLNNNELSGKIPTSLGKKNDFRYIDLSWNKLEGDASVLFGPTKKAEVVDVSRNLLEFDLTKVKFQESLTYLNINHNKIFGSLPPDMTKLVSLLNLNVSYNRLCGKIPVGGELQKFGPTEYFHNRCLCGAPLPDCK